MSSCTGHSYGLNGIGMRRGAQYKVLSTIYNILRRVSLIRHARQGHDFPTTTTPDGDDHVISRATALHTAAEAPHAPHTHARSFASTHGSRRLPSMLPSAISQTQARKRSTRSWTTWRLEPHDRDGSMSRSLRSAMMMIFRRSEDWKERASRLHSAAALTSVGGARAARPAS